ncbi:MAG: type IV pili twitching motility protein PilT [Myxococcales bacterium]|nr:type IV pili twitching motility protein PilT [Myxococcales bacterium]
MIDRGSSDFHFHVGSSPTFRQSGDMTPMRYRPIRQRDWARFVRPICPPGLWERWEATGDVDFAYEIEGLARFRVNLFRQHSGGGAVFRVIPSKILSLEELGMPPQLVKLAELDSGLVLITGPTGSGKSTTLAAIIDMINRRKAYHIITLEDPIEFVHRGMQSIIHQREVGTHARTFNDALKGAVREDPDLILVGEMRDRETIRLALEASEKGVLVFGTLHTNSATSTIDRIINVFPVADQDQIRSVLSDTIRGVVSQQLLRRKNGGRVAALEIMFSTSGMGNIIREGKTQQLSSLIQTGQRLGMITMDDSLTQLINADVITAEAAMEKAIEKERFKDLVEEELRGGGS